VDVGGGGWVGPNQIVIVSSDLCTSAFNGTTAGNLCRRRRRRRRPSLSRRHVSSIKLARRKRFHLGVALII